MDPLFLLMRLLHIALGVYWVGVVVFSAVLLMPSIRDTGPDGGKVMLALLRRGHMTVLPVTALLTVVSGFWMYMKLMSSIGPVWAGSMSARVYGVGAVAAVVAFGLGFFIIRANALKLRALMEAMPSTPEGPARAALMDKMTLPRAKMTAIAPWVAGLLIVATITMAIGRYM
jgi:hypothetical protein